MIPETKSKMLKRFIFCLTCNTNLIQMKNIKIAFLLLMIMTGLQGCIYDFIAPPELPPIDPDTEIIYATQIQPIFNNSCILCHKSGGTSPDLTAGNSYAQINTSKYINTGSPSQSLLYKRVDGTFSGHPTLSAAQAALILVWIQQGALNK